MAPRARIGRTVRFAGKALAVVTLVVACLLAAALAALDTAPVRSIVASEVTAALRKPFSGRIVIEHIGSLGPGGAAGIRARAYAPDGRPVLFADGLSARIDTWRLLMSLLSSRPIAIRLTHCRADYLDVSLDTDATGALGLARAFQPKPTAAPVAAPPRPGRGVHVTIAEASLARAWAHGRPSNLPVDADVVDARAALDVTPHAVTLAVTQASASSRGMLAHADIDGRVTFDATFPSGGESSMNAGFQGEIGGFATTAEAKIAGGTVAGRVSSERRPGAKPTLEGADLIPEGTHLRVDASGPFTDLSFRARVDSGPSTADVRGTATLSPTIRVTATARAEHVNARHFVRSAPTTDFEASAGGSFDLDTGVPRATFVAGVEPSVVAGVPLPRIGAAGSLDGAVLRATALADDRRGSARLGLTLRPTLAGTALGVDAAIHVADLAAATDGAVSGNGDVLAHGTVDLATERVVARATVEAQDIRSGTLRAGHIVVNASASGNVEDPESEVAVSIERLSAGEHRFRAATARVDGRLSGASFEARLDGESKAPSITAHGMLAISRGIEVHDTVVTMERDGTTVFATTPLVRVLSDGFRADHLAVLGLGDDVHAGILASARSTAIEIHAPRVDIRRAARIAGFDPKRFGGEIRLDVELHATPRAARGHLDVGLRNAVFDRDACGAADLRATFDGRRVDVLASGDWNGGKIEFRAEGVETHGSIFSPATWLRARGAADVSGDVDLARVRALVPADALPFEELRGRADVRLHVDRATPKVAPAIDLSIRTAGLGLSGRGGELEPADSTAVQAPSPWRVDGVDLDADFHVDPGEDHTDLRVSFHDRHGALAQVEFDSAALPPSLVDHPERARPFFERTRAHAVVTVPKRRFADFPPPLARPGLDGTVDVRVEANGTLLSPELAASLDVRGIGARERRRVLPLDGRLSAHYGDGALSFDGTVASAARVVLRADARAHADLPEILRGGAHRFDVDARTTLDGFPLETLSAVAARRIQGRLSGNVEARFGTGVDPFAKADLDVSDLSIGRILGNHLALTVNANRDTLRAEARLERKDGRAVVGGTVPIAFPFSAPGPLPPMSRAAELSVAAHHFRLALLRPLVESAVSDLDGRMDGAMTVVVSDGGQRTAMTGTLRLSGGAFEIPALGEEFSAVGADVTFDRSGKIAVHDFRAQGTTGKVKGSASIHVSGYTIDRATADVAIPKRDPLPVAVGGQTVADAWGKFHATLVRAGNSAPDVRIEVRGAGARLPNRSTHALQPLEPADRIRVGVMRAPGRFEILRTGPRVESEPSSGPGVSVTIDAKDVEVRRGTDLLVRIDGNPVVKSGRDQGVYGSITLHDGFLYVQGKKFEVEKGKVTFNGIADNPQVVATAGWTAPEGTRVYADFVGPLKTGKLTLRSDPPHTNSEILSLVLFGTTTGSAAPASGSSSPGAATAASAAGIGGGFAAQGLNRAIDDLTGLDVTARIDTSESANPRPELEVRIAKDVTVSLAHVLGVPPPGTNPDRNFATLDFRLHRHWSIATTFGDEGSSLLDLVWQFRY